MKRLVSLLILGSIFSVTGCQQATYVRDAKPINPTNESPPSGTSPTQLGSSGDSNTPSANPSPAPTSTSTDPGTTSGSSDFDPATTLQLLNQGTSQGSSI